MELLHELCLSSLGGDGQLPPAMSLALASSFGSAERWRSEFAALANASGSGQRWVVLAYLPHEGTLVNQPASGQYPAAGVPILALDLQGHADVDSFMDKLDWFAIARRYASAVHAASEGLGAGFDAVDGALVIDVRRAGVFSAADTMIPDAQWRDPASISEWMPGLPGDREILVYCVYGHEVGRNSAVRMRAYGLNARFLEGGIEAWSLASRPLISKAGAE